MRIDVTTETRVGITKDVLDVFARHQFILRGVEVIWHHIYLDVPRFKPEELSVLTSELLKIPGVWAVREIDLLPGERRRMHFDVLLSALPDPVLAIDGLGCVAAANQAAIRGFAIPEGRINGEARLGEILGTAIEGEICERVKRGSGGEVSINGRPLMLDVLTISGTVEDDGGEGHGAILIFRSLSRLGQDLYAIEKRETSGTKSLIGESSAMHRVENLIQRFAPINAPLLITGETGTGKELAARACHRLSDRAGKAFLALNCAALPENLVESELFGYASGAFSGAQKNGKPGLFELANGGTVLLDEIGEMSLYLQAKLLRFMQDGTFMRIGGKSETKVNVRLIAATHRDLATMVKEGSFREDLFYRLHVLGIQLPALRDRPKDIPVLARHFVQRASAQMGRKPVELAETAVPVLARAAWPGNVRQLENLLFRAVSLAEGDILNGADLEELLAPGAMRPDKAGENPVEIPSLATGESYAQTMDRIESELLARLYKEYPSSRKLAKQIGISHTAVANKLRRFGIA